MRSIKKTQRSEPVPQKRPFDVQEALQSLRTVTAPFPRAALFELAAEGHHSVFELLVACIISIRTYDEVTLPVARSLFARAPTPEEMATLSEQQIDELISAVHFS